MGPAEGGGEVGGQLGDRVAQAGAVLSRGVDGDLEGVGRAEDLLGCQDAVGCVSVCDCGCLGCVVERREGGVVRWAYTLSNSYMALRNFSCMSQTL